jgi:predicted DNA-binding ribbon-helix-helix protein
MIGEPEKTEAAAPRQKSTIVKRSIMIGGHQTSITLEDDFWIALREISEAQGVRVSELVATIDHDREHVNLCSAIRLYVLDYYRSHPAALA